jgi:uncharacterized damage-inducible protein DinB
MATLKGHLLTLARYHAWATRRLLEAHVAPLAEADYRRDVGVFFRSVHGTLNHLLLTDQQLWFVRFADGRSPVVRLDAEVEPDRGRLIAALLDGVRRWVPLIHSWPEARFDGELEYTRIAGPRVRLPFAPTLAHVFNHATHHRGQITAAITMLGQAGPELDLVYMLQEEQRALAA